MDLIEKGFADFRGVSAVAELTSAMGSSEAGLMMVSFLDSEPSSHWPFIRSLMGKSLTMPLKKVPSKRIWGNEFSEQLKYGISFSSAVEEGKLLWAKTGCYSCHGGKAEGGVGPSLTDDIWVFKPTDKTIFKTIAKGRSGTTMVGWEKELTKDEIWKIISYIRSLYSGSKSKIVW